jgi:hypothetical protein
MKHTLIAAALALLVLSGCNREEGVDSTSNPATSGATGGMSDPAGTATPPGAANTPAGNQAAPNTTDSTPTQEQLNPAQPANPPSTGYGAK